MADPTVDPAVFAELQASTGADFAAELLATFFDEAPPMIAELRAALAAGSADRFRRGAHSLKTNAQTFGAGTLAALARELEQGGLPPDGAAIDALEAAYGQAAAALAELARG